MRAADLLLAVAAALTASACGPASGGVGGAAVTGLTVTVRYTSPRIATITIDGDAHASNRSFGPYALTTTELVSGGSVGLVFDPSDAGDLRLCAEALDDEGDRLDKSCISATLVADHVVPTALTIDTFPF
jgi:hypothetical protein